jgi:GTP-binding protein
MFRVAIVGRPNVGKSTLFNRFCGARKAIVGDEPGITRDRIYGAVEWRGKRFEIIDTGGIIPNVRESVPCKILEQVQKAISEANLVILTVDGRAGVTALDEQLLPMLRKTGRPVWIAVNKLDAANMESFAAPFYAFGMESVFPISAEHNIGIADLLDAIVDCIAKNYAGAHGEEEAAEKPEEIEVAVVGRPNVGKSSLVNRLVGLERAIVSEIPGTTRDSVDTRVVRDGVCYRIIDTAGIRRKGKTDRRTEKVSVLVARRSLAQADVALLLLDAAEGVTKLDAAIGGYAAESGCSVLIIANKWDKVEKDEHTIEAFTASVRRRMKYLSFAPVLAVSALTGQRVSRIFEMVRNAREARRSRIPTAVLNHMFVPGIAEALRMHHPARKLEIRYITQAEVSPPTFVIFNSGSRPLHFSTERYLQNQLRRQFGFYASPIRIQQRLKSSRRKK